MVKGKVMRVREVASLAVLLAISTNCLGGCRAGGKEAKGDDGGPAPAARAGGRGPARPARWAAPRLERVKVIGKMNVPESVVVDPASGVAYVSNVVAPGGGYWADDGVGFIARLKPGGEMDVLHWKRRSRRGPLNGPKGMCIFKGNLYVADNSRVHSLPLPGAKSAKPVKFPPGRRYNDMATDGKAVYVSDTAAGKVIRADEKGHRLVKAPKGVNGITFFKGKMFAVSWTLHEVYELDPTGKADPKPFGLSHCFRSLDGIEVLDDGTFIVSDFVGNKVCAIAPDRKSVRTIALVKTPADIGLDRKRGLLYVPQFEHKQVVVYKLRRQ